MEPIDRAVEYARKLIREGMNPPLAFHKAYEIFNVSKEEINRRVSRLGGLNSHKKSRYLKSIKRYVDVNLQ